MPEIPSRRLMVRCPACDRAQPDEGRRNTCAHCGCQPIPSYDYPPGSSFHPSRANAETRAERIVRKHQEGR